MRKVFFDFDGTIADSYILIIEIAYELTKHSQLKDYNQLENLRKMGLYEVVNKFKIRKYKWPYLLYKGRKLMNQRLERVLPIKDVDKVFKVLKENNVELYIMSSNSSKNIELFLNKNNMRHYFTKIYGGVGLLNKARAFKKIIKKNKFNKKDITYIGDEPRDIESSREAGIKCIAVGWGFSTRELLEAHHPYKVVDTVNDLIATILLLNN